jgi:hypothetical protein
MTIVPCSSSPPERLDQTRSSVPSCPLLLRPHHRAPSLLACNADGITSNPGEKWGAFGELQRHTVRSRARASIGERIESAAHLIERVMRNQLIPLLI